MPIPHAVLLPKPAVPGNHLGHSSAPVLDDVFDSLGGHGLVLKPVAVPIPEA